jgi:hypothetical protein
VLAHRVSKGASISPSPDRLASYLEPDENGRKRFLDNCVVRD